MFPSIKDFIIMVYTRSERIFKPLQERNGHKYINTRDRRKFILLRVSHKLKTVLLKFLFNFYIELNFEKNTTTTSRQKPITPALVTSMLKTCPRWLRSLLSGTELQWEKKD